MIPLIWGFRGDKLDRYIQTQRWFRRNSEGETVSRAGKMKMDIERQVYGLPEELSCKSFLRRLILEWSFP